MNKELMLDVGQANELKLAFRRAGYTNELIKKLCEGAILEDVLAFMRGTAKIVAVAPADFPIWKTIKVGTGLKTADDFCRALEAAGYRAGDWTKYILGKPAFTAASVVTEVDLVVLSVAELGLPEGATRVEIYERAKERGLALCPAEVGPQLRRQYPDQPIGEWLIVAMEPIAGPAGLGAFEVVHSSDGRWLGTSCGDPVSRWRAGSRFVFSRQSNPTTTG